MAGDLSLPKQLIQILERLNDYGYSAYIYGECVRGLIKGQTLLDFDVLTNAELPRIGAIFDIDGSLVTVQGVAAGVTTYVNLEYELGKRHAFTYDTIAYNHQKGFFDPYCGISALENGEIRHLVMTNPDNKLTRRDLENVLMSRFIKEILMEYSGIFAAIAPELEQIPVNTLKCVGLSSPILTLRYALLFHELGKPDCHSLDWQGNDFYYGHSERARIYAKRIMTRLKCPLEEIQETEYIIENYEKILNADETNIFDLRHEHHLRLKLLLLFNCARCRAGGDEKTAMEFKKLSKMI
jgi:tRNA nucleotidyltransferase (CCA-adding enzyme)